MNILLLFVVTKLNLYKHLNRFLEGLIKQKYSNWRLPFVKGPSNKENKDWILETCYRDARFTSIKQTGKHLGIIGTMNMVFENALKNLWLIFWDSDNWPASENSFFDLNNQVNMFENTYFEPSLVFCSGIDVNPKNNKILRKTSFFKHSAKLTSNNYRNLLISVNMNGHQTTIFGQNTLSYIKFYSEKFNLSVDLDYFLKASLIPEIIYKNVELGIVKVGIISIKTIESLTEVIKTYYHRLNYILLFTFTVRYIKKITSDLKVISR
tara:strand:- start:289 stop:1086 length:798 start_codon:yes stop_codon:yes gene_type:complete